MPAKLSRRAFLRVSIAFATLTPIAACAPAAVPPTAAPATPPWTKPEPTSPPTEATKAPAPTAAPAAVAKPVEIRVHVFGAGSFGELMKDAYQADVDGWKSKHPNITPKIEGIDGWTDVYFPKIFALVSAGQLGDAVWQVPRMGSHLAWGAARFNIVRPLDEIAKAMNFDLKAQYFPKVLETSTWDGKLYYLNYCGEPAVPVIAFNKTKIEKMGLQVPAADYTYDELADWASKATTPDAFAYSKGHHGAGLPGESHVLRQWGAEFLNKEGKKVTLADSKPQLVEFFRWRQNLITQKLSPPPEATADPIDTFSAEKLLSLPVWPYWFAAVQAIRVKDKFEIAWRPLPVVKKGDKRRSQLNQHVFGVTTASKNPQEAFDYLTFVCGKEYSLYGYLKANGQPNGRMDVWEDPRIDQKYPDFKLLREAMLASEIDWFLANFRGPEMDDTYKNVYAQLELNKLTPEQTVDQLQEQCQAVASKEPA